MISSPWLIALIKVLLVFGGLMIVMPYAVLFERKILGWIQLRPGPNRIGPWGLFQPFADFIKLQFKENLIPADVRKMLYYLAPAFLVIPAMLMVSVIPIIPETTLFGLFFEPVSLTIADMEVGLLVLFALSSLAVYGTALGGWASRNKWSLIGGVRATSQMISYELGLGLSVIGIVMITGSLNLTSIVEAQGRYPFILVQPLGFLAYLIAAMAEMNRTPFDLPEAEAELVSGYNVEYSGMKFALFFLGEYVHLVVVSLIASTLFLGGYKPLIPFAPFTYIPGIFWLLGKMAFFIFFFIWVRGTLPRLRFDQLVRFGWYFLFPLALLNILWTGFYIIYLK